MLDHAHINNDINLVGNFDVQSVEIDFWETLMFIYMQKIKFIFNFFFEIFFFNCYLTAPLPTLGYYRGGSLTHPMLITVFYIFDPRITRNLITRLGP